jgi:spermidine synthase
MDHQAWQVKNRAAIMERLQGLRDKPDGIIYFEPAGIHFIIVTKDGTRLRLGQLEQSNPRTNITQSRLDLDDPLFLPAYYTQAIMLGLIWQNKPNRVCVLGFGGGRIPMLLHHYFPEVVIECADIDPAMVEVALKFFGVRLDDRLSVALQDGREYLADRNQNTLCDLIVVDVNLGNGFAPYRLATQEFYQLCRAHLSKAGVVIVNLLSSDPFYAEKVKTIHSVFEHIYICAIAGNTVIFATHGPVLDQTELVTRAGAVEAKHQFSFPFAKHAPSIKTGSALNEHIPNLDEAQIFVDDSPPSGYFDNLPSFNTNFGTVAPEHPCPCGSGKLFEQCHGRGVAARS